MVLFTLRYAGAELQRRWSRALITALGLAAAVGLIVAITALSTGFNRAGDEVLAPLTKVGSDLLVTQAAPESSGTDASSAALIDANRSVVTNLAALGKPGAHFTHDFFLLPSLLPVADSTTAKIEALPGVRGAVGALTVLGSHQTGVVPAMVASLTSGGTTVSQVHRPASLTPAEADGVRACILSDGGLKDLANNAGAASKALPGQIEKCLPARFKEYVASVNVPLQTVRQVLNPPQTNIRATPYTAAGIDISRPDDGVVTRSQVSTGRFLTGADEMLADSTYASSAGLKVGSSLPVNGRTFHVVGLVSGGIGGQSANLYFPLATMQSLAGQQQHVNVILVHADSAADVAAVQKQIERLLPSAHVATATQLAAQVQGTLAGAKRLTHRFGLALAVVVLLAAFLVTVLLTLGSVAKRVKEIGTLRAVGWSRRRVVAQLVVETVGIGVVGAIIGIGLGAVMAAAITHYAPALDAHSATAGGASSLAKLAGVVQPTAAATTMHIKIVASVSALSLVYGAALALAGALLAGVIGGWRAASLTPSVALRDLG
ncbi:MAG: rane protein [Frankiales bacterium]|nr:rane protein [Frankiales bacterium]